MSLGHISAICLACAASACTTGWTAPTTSSGTERATSSEAVPATSHNQLTEAEAAEGWQLLFDGSSTANFRSYNKPDVDERWQIEGDTLVLTQAGGGDLITRDSWSDFELRLEWWVENGGNSGIFFLADESDLPIYVHAPEVQILDNKRHKDRKQADRRSGSLYDMIAAPPSAQKPAEQWNSLVLRLESGRLQCWQNGVQTIDVQIGGKRWKALVENSKFKTWPGFGENRTGHVGLQDHGDRVAFRNLKVRSLGESL